MLMTHPDPIQDIERLRALRRTGLLTSPPPPEFQRLCEQARTRFAVAAALITLVAEDRIVVAARAGTDLKGAPRLGQFCDQTIRSDAVLVVPDAARDPLFAGHPFVAGPPFFRFYAGAPLVWVRGARLGAFCVLDDAPRTFAPGDQADLERMADEAMGALASREFDRIADVAFH